MDKKMAKKMKKKAIMWKVLGCLVMSAIVMSALPVSVLAVNGSDNIRDLSNSLNVLENTIMEETPSSGDCAPVPDAYLPEIYLNDTQECILSNDSGNDTNIIILTDVSDDTRETVSALGCDVYVKIDDPCCKGYKVYVDGVYQFTEGQDGTPDGYCAFHVCAGKHTIKITKNGRSASKTKYFQCGYTYRWTSMPHCWCEDGGGSDDCKYPPTVKFDKTKYYEGDTVHATVSTSLGSVYYKIKDCGGTVRKSGTTSNGKKISYTIPKGASKCCYWQICFYWNEYTPPWMALAGAGGVVTALSYDCTKCYNFYVCPVQTCEVYVTIEDPCCVGYKVYVDGVYQFTEGGDGTPPDGYCAFHVKEGTHTLKITKNGRSASKTIYFECNAIYHWVRMPKNWCGDGEAYVEIKDKYCKGYDVYVDDKYKLTEGQTGTPDGNCGFFVGEGTKTIEIRKNGQSASLTKYFDCSYRYVWDSMPDNWCNPCADPPTVTFDKPKYNEGDAMFATVSTSSGSVNYEINDCGGTVRKSGDISNGGAIYYTIPKGTSKNCCNWQICFYWGENSPPFAAAAGAGGGEVTAQSYDCTKCYEFEVCPGEKPAPEIINVTYPIMCVKEGENATISVTVENKGGTSSEGYISVSFPNDEDVSVVSGTGNGYNKLYPKGFWSLWNSKGEQMTSVDPLVELFETNWDAGEKHTLTMNVKPNSGSDEIEFLVRAALKNDADGNYERDPTSGDTDQQGWYAKKYSVDVCGGDTIPVKFIGEITGEGTPISSYQFDVRVDEILSDPRGKLEVGETASVWAHGSTFTIEAGVGDRVEVLGFYRGTIEDMDKIQLENPSHFLEEQAYRWIKTDENAKFDCGTNNEYFNVSFYSDWLATQIMIEAETGENYQSRGPVLFWLNKPPDVSDWMRVLDASKGMIELWPNKFEEAKGLKIYYRITPYSTEKDKFNRVAWISKAGFESLTGENKDFVVYILGVAYGVQIFGGSDGVHDGYITTYEGNITKDFAVGDEINLDVPSGSITLKILELKWSPKNADWLEMVKVDYEIESEEALSADFSIEPSQNINLGDVVTFDASSSTGDIVGYKWCRGDEAFCSGGFTPSPDYPQFPDPSDPTAKHLFMYSGTHPVTLTVVDSSGNSKSVTKTVNVIANSKYPDANLEIYLTSKAAVSVDTIDYTVMVAKVVPLRISVQKYSDSSVLSGVDVGSAVHREWHEYFVVHRSTIPATMAQGCLLLLLKAPTAVGVILDLITAVEVIEFTGGFNLFKAGQTDESNDLILHIPYEYAETISRHVSGGTVTDPDYALIKSNIAKSNNLEYQNSPEQYIFVSDEDIGLSEKAGSDEKLAYIKKIDPLDIPESLSFYYEPYEPRKPCISAPPKVSGVSIFAKHHFYYPDLVIDPHAKSIANFINNKDVTAEYIDPAGRDYYERARGSEWIIVLCSPVTLNNPNNNNPQYDPWLYPTRFGADMRSEDLLTSGDGWKIIKYKTKDSSEYTWERLYYIVTEDNTEILETAVKEFLKIIGEELGGSDGLDQLISTPIETSPDPQSTNFGTVLEDRTRTWGL